MSNERARLLLMHGAGLGAWVWHRVTPLLTASAEAFDLPGRGDGVNPGEVTLQHCIDAAAARVRAGDGRCVLVGHSISAEVALAVAARETARVAAVVLVGGVVPESGKSFLSLLPPPQLFLRVLLWRGRNGIALPKSGVRKGYCNDLDAAATELVMSRIVPEAPRLYLDPVDWSALPASLPRIYVKLLDDKSVGVKQQDRFSRRVGATRVESLQTGHLPMLAQPQALAAILDRIAADAR